MVGITEISAGLSSLKAAKDIIQGFNAASTQAAINEVKLDLQSHLLEAQQALFAAQEAHSASSQRIASLEQEIVRLKNWEAEKQCYELADTGRGTLAYRHKAGMENGEPPHWLCPNCYQQGQKSIMKHEFIAVGKVKTLVCHPCGMDILVEGLRNDRSLSRAPLKGF